LRMAVEAMAEAASADAIVEAMKAQWRWWW